MVHHLDVSDKTVRSYDLNTSYVMVHHGWHTSEIVSNINLNTSYVMVHHKTVDAKIVWAEFKYILCYGSSS